MKKKVLIEVSARHLHLCQEDVEKLFGKGHELKKLRDLSQPSDFAAEETVIIENNGKQIKNVRVIGPTRERSYIEISRTDAHYLEMDTFLKVHGDETCHIITVIGTQGKIRVCAIRKHRHLHVSDKEAKKLGLKEKQKVKIKVSGERAIVFENVVVRINPNYKLSMHVDTDEGNAAGINIKTWGEIIK